MLYLVIEAYHPMQEKTLTLYYKSLREAIYKNPYLTNFKVVGHKEL